MEDKGALPSGEEGGDLVDHVRGYTFGEQERPELGCVDVIETGFYVEEDGGHFQEGSLEGSDLVGAAGHRVGGTEASEGAALVPVEQACISC